MSTVDGRRGIVLPIAVTIVGLAAIGIAEDLPTRHSIEHKLTDSSTDALRQAGIGQTGVSFVGRDGTVHVASAADADRALAVVEHVNGVRVARVIVALGSGPTSPIVTPSATPSVTITATPSEAPSSAAPVPSAAPSAATSPTPGASSAPSVPPASPSTSAPSAPSASPPTSASPPPGGSTSLGQVQAQLGSLREITFATGSAILSARDKAIVKQVAAILTKAPDVRIRIQGDTDSSGPAAFNLMLSRSRANAVFTALRGLGVAPDRMTVVGYGETKPKVPNNSPENRAINRRVDFAASA
jgi:outer membrane protein OmpA-like peptidoglycan-associated protein